MKVTVDIDFVNEEIFITDEIGNKEECTPIGHAFWGVCPSHIGLSLNDFLESNWDSYKALVNNPEYLRLAKQYEKLLIQKAKLLAKINDIGTPEDEEWIEQNIS